MLYSQGVTLEDLEIGQRELKDPRKVWRIFACHYYLFRGKPTRMWLDFAFQELFGLHERLSEKTADAYFDAISEKMQAAEFRPRALYERFQSRSVSDNRFAARFARRSQKDSRVEMEGENSADVSSGPGGRPGLQRVRRQRRKTRRANRGRHLDMDRILGSTSEPAQTFSRTGLHCVRSRASYARKPPISRRTNVRSYSVEC